METSKSEIDDLVGELDGQSAKERRVFSSLLDKYSQVKGKVLAIRNEMGFTLEETGQKVRIPSFVVVQTLDWVGKEVLMGSQMPFMQGHIDAKGRLLVNESIAESVKQRAPDWTRQAAITAYLAHDRRRKFGTIVAVLNPPWVDDLKHENWGGLDGNKRALKSAYKFEALDSRGRIGLLDLEDTLIYALDGQHRVMGIRGIQEFRDFGHLTLKNRDGQAKTGDLISREEFLKDFNLTTGDLQSLLNDTISLELIPAVLAGERADQASQRVRSVFITINAYAERTGKGETVLLDESDGYALVGRKAGTLHPLFKDDRVNWKTSTLPRRTKWYTTLDTLKGMASYYLPRVNPKLTKSWEPMFKKQVPIRPDEGDIEIGRKTFFELLDHLRELPVFKGLESGDDLDDVRLFPGDDPANHPDPKGHLLVRPVGQTILALAVGALQQEGMSLDAIFSKLAKWDRAGGFTQHTQSSLWYGVTFDIHKNNMNTRTNEEMSARLLQYMVRGADEKERKELLEFVVKARLSGGTPDKPLWTPFSGDREAYDPNDPSVGKELPRPIDRL
jgi:DndB-like DNA-sulfur modification-associated protein